MSEKTNASESRGPFAVGRRRAVILLLRFLSLSSLTAFGVVFLPQEWINRVHLLIDSRDLPDLPFVSYLSRSLSLFYAWLGAIILFVSFDIDRYHPLIRFFAVGGLVIASCQSLINFISSLPAWWIISESGFLFAYFSTLVWLTRPVAVSTR